MALEGIKAKPGTGSDPEFAFVSADDGSGTTRKFPRTALVLATDSAVEHLQPGQQTKAHSVPATLASDQESLTRCNGSVAVKAISVSTTAAKLGTGTSSVPLANRKRWRIRNLGPAALFLGPSGVASASGLRIDVGGSDELEIGPGIDMYGITASGTADVRVMELA